MSSKKKIYLIFLFLILLYIFFTNSYFGYQDSLIYGGADGFSYYEISKFAPKISATAIQPIHSERFFFHILSELSRKYLT